MFTLRENLLFYEKWTRSFELESVSLIRKTLNFFTMFRDPRERIEANRAAARIGWRPCRPVPIAIQICMSPHVYPSGKPAVV
jgi:hypothetical protein